MPILFDIETNGLLQQATKIHCLVTKDTETGVVNKFGPEDVEAGLRTLHRMHMGGMNLCGHNVVRFDCPVITKLYPWFAFKEENVLDTLVLSRLMFPDMGDRDSILISQNTEEYTRFPKKLWGRHSLKAWGWRLGNLKGDFAEEQEDAWAVFTPEMLDYCIQDVEVLESLYNKLTGSQYSEQAIELEHQVAFICASMERSGWPFDVQGAAELYGKLVVERNAIQQEMLTTFEPIVIERYSDKTGKRLKDKVIEFNPASRKQIGERLITKYGWKPTEFTDAGQPKVDETVLSKLQYPEAKTLARFFLLEKRLGQIAEGEQAWLKLEKNGFIHGSVNTNGAVTGRCTHAAPNMAQVPSARAEYGPDCRRLFHVLPGFKQVGVDLSGLELRCLAHFMYRWDSGEYAREVLQGDVHTKNQIAAGLPTRDAAKTFIYAFLYGAGDELVGNLIGKGRGAGARIKKRFLEQTPALAKLKSAVTKAAERGYLVGLDGRKLPVRSAHSALNLLLQSAGALIAKRWIVEVVKEAEARGYRYGWDADFTMLGFVHDEIQFAVREDLAEDFGKMVVECAARAGVYFKFNCPVGAEYKIGMNWYDTH